MRSLILPFLVLSLAAQSPERVFAGKVLLSERRFPMSAKSAGDYIAELRRQSASNFYEEQGKRDWKIHFAAFFRGALDDVEVQVKIYDVSTNPQKLLSSFDQYLDERGQKSFISSMVLDEKTCGVNKQLMVTLESHGKVLAAGRFKILGQQGRESGKVDFSPSGGKKN